MEKSNPIQQPLKPPVQNQGIYKLLVSQAKLLPTIPPPPPKEVHDLPRGTTASSVIRVSRSIPIIRLLLVRIGEFAVVLL